MTEPSHAGARKAPSGGARSWRDRMLHGWLDGRDRAAIFTEAAGAATDTGVPYWLVLLLAGAIAALGLALNSAAVVIGAMLIAPLLAPVVGLALALAIGDGRLAVEVALVVLLSTVAVVLVGALLALVLPVPFQTLTPEIASRTRPTTLDLAIAACSGLAGAVVTVARRSRLSGAVPGVAVSVALVPPLAATGYGIGTGWNWPIVRGSLLLYGANLAGIVMSAMAVFLLAGMHRAEVLDVDRRWHHEAPPTALAAWVERIPGLRSLGVMRSVWARLGLVAAFVALVAIPLREGLKQIARESRVQRAVEEATNMFSAPGQSFVVSRDVELGPDQTRVVLNVATTGWFGDSTRREFERRASAAAAEPVTLTLEQLPASSGDVSQLAKLLAAPHAPAAPAVAPPPPTIERRVSVLRAQVDEAVRALALPDSAVIIGSDFTIGDSVSGATLGLAYAAPDSLATQTRQVVERQLAAALALPRLGVEPRFVSTAPRSLSSARAPAVDSVAALLRHYPRLRAELLVGTGVSRSRVDSAARRLADTSWTDPIPVRSVVSRGLAVRVLPR